MRTIGDKPSRLPVVVLPPDRRQVERFYTRQRRRIDRWLAGHRVNPTVRSYLLLLAVLFALLARLLREPSIDVALKAQLALATAYVLSPVDLIPDALLPLGLIDDTTALAIVLSRVVRIMGEAGEDLLQAHWEGQGDVLAQIRGVLSRAERLLNPRTVRRLRRIFGR